jgi:hypothetical protein
MHYIYYIIYYRCPDSGPRATRMPTDDDYGRRERQLLHQHPANLYGQPLPASSLHGSAVSNSISNVQSSSYTTPAINCYHKHHLSSNISHSSVDQDQYRTTSQTNDQLQHQYSSASIGRKLCQPMSQNIVSDHRFTRYSDSDNSGNDQTKQSSGISSSPTREYHSYQPLSSVTDRCHQSQSLQKKNISNSNSDYANSSILVGVSVSGNTFSSETFPSPPSPAPVSDRFIPPPPLSPSTSEKYTSSQSLVNYPSVNQILCAGSASARDLYITTSPSPIFVKEQRFASAERLLATASTSTTASATLSSVVEGKDQQQFSSSSTERLFSSASPVPGVLSSAEKCVYGSSSLKDVSRSSSAVCYSDYSTERLLSSSPIHVPVPERFASTDSKSSDHNSSYLKDSLLHEHYHNQPASVQEQQNHHNDRFVSIACTTEKYLSSVSPNIETQHQRYTSNERILVASIVSASGNNDQVNRRYSTDRAVESTCQKYEDSRALVSPAPTEYSVRFPGYQDNVGGSVAQRYASTSDRFNDLAIQRYAQSRATDKFSSDNECCLSNNSNINHDIRKTNRDTVR